MIKKYIQKIVSLFYEFRGLFLLISGGIGILLAIVGFRCFHEYYSDPNYSRLATNLTLLVLSIPTLWVLWLFRTHDVKIQIKEARKNNHFNAFANAMKLFIESGNTGAKAIGLILLIKIRNEDQLYIKEIDLATPNKDLRGVQLQNANLQNANLAGANLTKTKLAGAKLAGAKLEGANLTGADLTLANLAGVGLTGANLTGANLTGAKLAEASLTGANLAGANLALTNLTGTDLTIANLERANLAGVDLIEADLAGAKLTGAKLTGAKYSDETTDYADLRPEERGMIKMKLNENDEWVKAD